IGRLSWHLLFQDHLAGIIDNAHRRFFHRHIKTHEMRHLIAPSDARARTDLDPCIVTEGDAPSASKAEPQPPRYTLLTLSSRLGRVDWRSPSRRKQPSPRLRLDRCCRPEAVARGRHPNAPRSPIRLAQISPTAW